MSVVKLVDKIHVIDACNSDFATSRFEDVRLAGSSFTDVTFAGSQFVEVLFDDCSFERASFVGVNLSPSQCKGLKIDGLDVALLLESYRASHGAEAAGGAGATKPGSP